MRGAHERNVLRWEARVALLEARIARLERELARVGSPTQGEQRDQAERQLENARRERASLGPAPRPKMG
jgi:hypothetical protein